MVSLTHQKIGRMKPHRLPALLLLPVTAASGFTDITLSDDMSKLTFSQNGKVIAAPLTRPEQVGFISPAASVDGKTIGWLALTLNCCTSYPLPTALVLYRNGKVSTVLGEGQPIWRWVFTQDGTIVSFVTHPPHGAYEVNYFRHQVIGGKRTARYRCDPERAEDATGKSAPKWIKPIIFECPML